MKKGKGILLSTTDLASQRHNGMHIMHYNLKERNRHSK
jgi:hypothetical protein